MKTATKYELLDATVTSRVSLKVLSRGNNLFI